MFKKAAVLLLAVFYAFSVANAQPAEDAVASPDVPVEVAETAEGVVAEEFAGAENEMPAVEEEDASMTQPDMSAVTVAASEASAAPAGTVTLDFRDADIQNVLRILAFKSGVNIVTGPEVTGLVTIQLRDVPWEQALAVILETYGYGYDRKGNIITVTTIENLKKRREDAAILAEQKPLVTKTYIINYGKASEIIASIEKLKSDRGKINFDERTNTIIVQDIEESVALIGEVVAKLDRVTPQVLIEAKIVETTLNDSDELGIDWTIAATVAGAKRPTTWPFSVNPSNRFTTDDFPGAEDSDFSYGTLNASQLQAVFEMLRTRTDTNILSNPKIVTLDNQSAMITVGSQYPIPTYTYNEEQARLQVNGWEYKDIGIIFTVTPNVNSAGYVTLDIEPKITEILDFVTVENTSLPRLSNESAKTRVMVKDGETLVIAGLIKDKVTDTKKKVPFLGDVPLLGMIFQKDEKTVTKTDLLIFLTPRIITPDTDKQ